MKIRLAAFAIGVLALSSAAQSQSLSTAPTVFKAGNWAVLRTLDTMTDEVSCTGIYKGDKSIQLTSNSLFISVQGGIESVTLRFGEQAPERLRLATKMEKSVRSIAIEGAEFSKLLGSTRLRVQSLTLVRGIARFDLDLSGLSEAISNIQNGCPGEPEPQSAEPPSLCSETVLARLKARNISQDDIDFVCAH